MGQWLEKNGESIYGTTGAPNFPYILPWGEVTYHDGNCTLYLHVKKYPRHPYKILLTGLETRAVSATLVCDGTPLKLTQFYEIARNEHRLSVYLPQECPDPRDTVIAVKLEARAKAQVIGTAVR